MKYPLLLTLMLCAKLAFLQNLVTNGGFEKHAPIDCINCYFGTGKFEYTMPPWKSLGTGFPLICDCRHGRTYDEKRNRMCQYGLLQPHNGCTTMQMKYWPNYYDYNRQARRGSSNYLATELAEPLEVGSVYEVSFWLHILEPESHGYEKHIGMSLYPKPFRNPKGILLETPFIIDTVIHKNWYRVKWKIRPGCNLRFLVIGVFKGQDGPPVNGRPDHNAFYIDDVAVKKIEVSSEEALDAAFFCKYRKGNPASLPPEIKGATCHFASNSSVIPENEKAILDSFALRLKRNPKAAFIVFGHTDEQGDNHAELSKERVNSVLGYLKEKHRIPQFRFVKIYAGNTMPIATNETENGRELNRRVEFLQSNYRLSTVFYRNLLLYLEDGNMAQAYRVMFAWLLTVEDKYKMLMFFDPRIEQMKKDRRWAGVIKRVKKGYGNFTKPELAFTLDSLWAEDQKPRTLKYWIENLNVYIKDTDEGDAKWDVFFEMTTDSIIAKDSQLFLLVDSIILADGWPKISEVGERSAKVAFLASTHSNDTLVLSRYIPLVKNSCLEGEAEWYWYATMSDRLATLKGLPQKYGTQYKLLGGDNERKKRFPLEDKAKVNEWRMEIGLLPININ